MKQNENQNEKLHGQHETPVEQREVRGRDEKQVRQNGGVGGLHEKRSKLERILSSLAGAVVAFSGGLDSTLLVSLCKEVLGSRVLAVTASSPTYPREELERAKELAKEIGVEHVVIETEELSDPLFASNPPDRCYHCKQLLFARLRAMANQRGLQAVLDGENASDSTDFRPGSRAAREAGVRSPLAEAGLTKEEIRALSRERSLPTWNLPPAACLASRIPYGVRVEPKLLAQIEAGERLLHSLGFELARVRAHGTLARVEVDPKDIGRLLEEATRDRVVRDLKLLGFAYVTADLQGYRTGSMNEEL